MQQQQQQQRPSAPVPPSPQQISTSSASADIIVLNTTPAQPLASISISSTANAAAADGGGGGGIGNEQRFAQLRPVTLPHELLEGLERHSVDALCSLGREIVHDLTGRAQNLLTALRHHVTNDRRRQQVDVDTLLAYCRWLFEKLVEIRLLIDKKRLADATPTTMRGNGGMEKMPTTIKSYSDEELLAYFADPRPTLPPPQQPLGEEKQQLLELKLAEFEANRTRLVGLSTELKRLDWLAAVGDPHHLMAAAAATASLLTPSHHSSTSNNNNNNNNASGGGGGGEGVGGSGGKKTTAPTE